jgi:hypothetical protein
MMQRDGEDALLCSSRTIRNLWKGATLYYGFRDSKAFNSYLLVLNLLKTGHIIEQIEIIKKIVDSE